MYLQAINITSYFISSVIIVIVLSILAVIIGSKVKKLDINDEPGKILTLAISFIEFFNNFVKKNIGKHWRYVAPLTLTLAIYIFIANISGLFLLDAPTKYTVITFSLALFSIMIVQSTGIVSQGWRHFKTLTKPSFLMLPLNIMSDLTPLISMTLRLFGNIASGAVLITLIYRVTGYFSPVVVVLPHIIFDVAFGLIQTVVFVLLTVIFASGKVKDEDFDIEEKGEKEYA